MLSRSHPVRVRGLKRKPVSVVTRDAKSHPVRVRGLKLHFPDLSIELEVSHPVRVRGLKRVIQEKILHEPCMSHPVRVRGLKLENIPLKNMTYIVAPRAGAWIETME